MKKRESNGLISIFHAMEDGVFIMGQDYIIKYMNPALIRDFGDGVGKHCFEVVEGVNEPCARCRASDVFAGMTVHRDIYFARNDKTYDIIDIPLKDLDGNPSKLTIYRDISQRKIREEKLREIEQDYRGLFEHVPCGVFYSSKEGRFVRANRALLDMLGYDRLDEFLAMDIARDLYLRREDRVKFQELMELHGHVKDYEVEFKRRDGKAVPVLLSAYARRDREGNIIGYEGINLDLSNIKAMENRLRDARDFLDNILRNSPNAIIATDMKGNIIIWNKAAEETLGYKEEEVIGKMHIEAIYPKGVAKEVMKMMRSHSYGGKGRLHSYPMVHVRKDGAVIEGNLSVTMVYDHNGEEIASVGIFVDLTERFAAEAKLRRIQDQLLQSEKLAAMGRLTSQIAHELNNPLYGIMNTLELMKTEIPPENRRRKILEMALSETVRLTDMLRKMLSFSKPDQEERQETDMNGIIEEILLLYEKQLRENSIKISCSFGQGIGKVFVSRNQMRQVLLNMISNAKDAMPEGGTLSIRTWANGDNMGLEISDTGIGIKEEHLPKIFEAFFTTKESVKGVGLGLSVCYGFIKDHGGDITVESKRGEGTTFTITLPLVGRTLPEK